MLLMKKERCRIQAALEGVYITFEAIIEKPILSAANNDICPARRFTEMAKPQKMEESRFSTCIPMEWADVVRVRKILVELG